MSTRQRLLRILSGLPYELRAQIADEVLNEHAHELAKKQRVFADSLWDRDWEPISAVEHAISLIEPDQE